MVDSQSVKNTLRSVSWITKKSVQICTSTNVLGQSSFDCLFKPLVKCSHALMFGIPNFYADKTANHTY